MLHFKNVSLLVLFGLLVWSCEESATSVREPYTGPISKVTDFDATVTDSGKVKNIINSELMLELKNGDRSFPKGMVLETLNDQEKIETTLQSDSAYFNKKKQLWVLKKNVELHNILTGEHLFTEELYWDMKATDSTNVYVKPETNVLIRTGTQVFKGKGLRTSQDFENYEILNLTGAFDIEDEDYDEEEK
ncbi:LPS export ABC transporter periplasmic protein LptC [Cyclobacteriaceae bacterium]|nr:LPS export ABC transporter periplasmic protein LptC [Cyclobacteriaceae bacterium]